MYGGLMSVIMNEKHSGMHHRQIGQFQMEEHLIESNPDNVARILMLLNFVPLRVDRDPASFGYKYCGISDMFQKLPRGAMAPEYEIIVHAENGVIKSVEAKVRS
jgi:hypothetical protein